MTCQQVAEVCQHIAARVESEFVWTHECARYRRQGEVYQVGERIRPGKSLADSTGFEYEATTVGQVGLKEPRWKLAVVADALLDADGAVVWQAKPISNSSLRKTIASSSWTAPAALVVDGQTTVSVGGEQKTRAYIAASGTAVAGETYRVLNEVTFSDGSKGVGIYDVEIEE